MRGEFCSLGFFALLVAVLTSEHPGVLAQSDATATDPRQTAIRLEEEGKNAEAQTTWQAVLKAQPRSAEAYAHLGFLEARQERYKQAVPLYCKAMSLDPAMPGLRMNLGLALFKTGDLKEAISTFERLLSSEPLSSPEAQRLRTLIGMAHYGLQEYGAAVPDLKQATTADPENLPFRLMLAHSCLAAKQYQCVLDVYHEVLMPICWLAKRWMRCKTTPALSSSFVRPLRRIPKSQMCTSVWDTCCGPKGNTKRQRTSFKRNWPMCPITFRHLCTWRTPT